MTQRLLGENKEKKRFSVLGDSLSTFEGYSEPAYAVFYDTARKLASGVITYADTWWGRVIDALGGELLVNNSFAGSTVCKRPDYEIPSYACSDERTSALAKDGVLPDVVFVYVGTNDWGRGFRVRKDENEWEEDECVFSTAYDRMLKKLRKNYLMRRSIALRLPSAKFPRIRLPCFRTRTAGSIWKNIATLSDR